MDAISCTQNGRVAECDSMHSPNQYIKHVFQPLPGCRLPL